MKIIQGKKKRIPLILRNVVEEKKKQQLKEEKKIPKIYYGITP